MEKHNCGGTLQPARVRIVRQIGKLRYVFEVDGLRCTRCSEEVITRDVAVALERSVAEARDESVGLIITAETPQILLPPTGLTTEGVTGRTMNYAVLAL